MCEFQLAEFFEHDTDLTLLVMLKAQMKDGARFHVSGCLTRINT